MRRALFIGHAFHAKSGSSRFFVSMLRTRFAVETVFLAPDGLDPAQLPDGAFDLVVLWQLDILAPHYIAAGYRTVVAPMYDASAALPDRHFAAMRDALFVNFSAALHVRAVRLGCRSLFVRYYPDPADFAPVRDYSTARGFFWRRRPDDVSLEMVDTLLGDALSALHVHNAPDYGEAAPIADGAVGFGACTVTQSAWGESAHAYRAALEEANIYVAPRLAEGIGMGFLEAMARGMAVFANDLPTHSEYIANWYNGVLFNRERVQPVKLDRLAEIGAAARRTVERGHRHFLLQARTLLDALDAAAGPRAPRTEALMVFARAGIEAYARSPAAYAQFLDSHKDGVEFYVLGRLGAVRRLLAAPQPHRAGADRAGRIAGALHLAFGEGNAGAYLGTGWSTPEGSHTWIDGECATLRLPANPALAGQRVSVSIDAFTVDPLCERQTMEILIDGETAGRLPLRHSYRAGGIVTVRCPQALPHGQFEITLRAGECWPEPGGGRRLSLALRTLSIVRDARAQEPAAPDAPAALAAPAMPRAEPAEPTEPAEA